MVEVTRKLIITEGVNCSDKCGHIESTAGPWPWGCSAEVVAAGTLHCSTSMRCKAETQEQVLGKSCEVCFRAGLSFRALNT